MTWFGWLLIFWWVFATGVNLYVAGRIKSRQLPAGADWKVGVLSHGSMIATSVITLILILLVLTVGTGYGI